MLTVTKKIKEEQEEEKMIRNIFIVSFYPTVMFIRKQINGKNYYCNDHCCALSTAISNIVYIQ